MLQAKAPAATGALQGGRAAIKRGTHDAFGMRTLVVEGGCGQAVSVARFLAQQLKDGEKNWSYRQHIVGHAPLVTCIQEASINSRERAQPASILL